MDHVEPSPTTHVADEKDGSRTPGSLGYSHERSLSEDSQHPAGSRPSHAPGFSPLPSPSQERTASALSSPFTSPLSLSRSQSRVFKSPKYGLVRAIDYNNEHKYGKNSPRLSLGGSDDAETPISTSPLSPSPSSSRISSTGYFSAGHCHDSESTHTYSPLRISAPPVQASPAPAADDPKLADSTSTNETAAATGQHLLPASSTATLVGDIPSSPSTTLSPRFKTRSHQSYESPKVLPYTLSLSQIMEYGEPRSSSVKSHASEESLKRRGSRPRPGRNSSYPGIEKPKRDIPVEDPVIALARKLAELELDTDDDYLHAKPKTKDIFGPVPYEEAPQKAIE
jgi:hypothetical protein